MAVLQLNDKQFPLSATTTRIGAGADADVVLPTDASVGVQAVIERTGEHALAIRRAAPQSEVRVNGVLLGPEPTPLMHGDKVEVAGLELRFADESKRGATQYMSLEAIPQEGGARRTGAARETLATGGRLISLVDGKEYMVSEKGLVIGRDAGSDVVVPRNEVSRRHAEVAPTDSGYVVRDMSSNGVYVNGERVQGSQRLARADVIRVGGEEFRFYADVVNPTPPSASQATGEGVVLRADTPAPSLANTLFNQRAVTGGDPRPVFATLEVLNEGPSKGVRYQLRTALAHIGRGANSDVRLTDESVSEIHAKIQRRGDGWYAVDMNSTNGTWVDGSRVTGERRLDGAPDIRFGGVKLRFIPAGMSEEALNARASRPAAATTDPRQAATTPQGGTSRLIWALLVLLVAAAVLFVLRGRA
ncbi:MAG TPA: FHA domain-containing protein [Gemmatimonadaceae bacterium]